MWCQAVGGIRRWPRFTRSTSSADLIVSSYAPHHLPDAGQRALIARAAQWLRPGGLVQPDLGWSQRLSLVTA